MTEELIIIEAWECPYGHGEQTEEICVECKAKPDPYNTSEEVQTDLFSGHPFRIITEPDTAVEIMEKLVKEKPELLAFDVETTGLSYSRDIPHGFSLATQDMTWYFVNGAGMVAAPFLKRLGNNSKTRIVGHNIKFDLHFIHKWGVTISDKQLADTMVMAWMINENQSLALKTLSEIKLGVPDLPAYNDLRKEAKKPLGVSKFDDVSIFDLPLGTLGCYAARDTRLTYDLYLVLLDELKGMNDQRMDFVTTFFDIEMPFLHQLFEMEHAGLYVNMEKWEVANEFYTEKHKLAEKNWEELTAPFVTLLTPSTVYFPQKQTTDLFGLFLMLGIETPDEWWKHLQKVVKDRKTGEDKVVEGDFPKIVLKEMELFWEREQDNYAEQLKEMKARVRGGEILREHSYTSNKHLVSLFFDTKKEGGLGLKPTGYTKGSMNKAVKVPSVDAINLIRLRRKYDEKPEIMAILNTLAELKDTKKLLSTYLEPLRERRDGDSFVHPSLNQTGTVTGRLSSSGDVNGQNQPNRGEKGMYIRNIFTAPPDGWMGKTGWQVLVADYSQLELRLLAHFSRSEKLINLFLEDGDPHQLTADLMNVDRYIGKTINFSWAYGAWAGNLQDTIEKNGYKRPKLDEAKGWLTSFDDAYPELVAWKQQVVNYATKIGGIRTIAGRWRNVQGLGAWDYKVSSRANRQAVNSLIQGSAGDVMKKAMLDLRPFMPWYGAKMVMQVHDEIVIYIPGNVDVEEVSEKVSETMTAAGEYFDLRVPLVAEPGVGSSWYEGK